MPNTNSELSLRDSSLSDTEEEMINMPQDDDRTAANAEREQQIAATIARLPSYPATPEGLRALLLESQFPEFKIPRINQLLNENPDLLNQAYKGFTPLMLACTLPSYKIAEYLLQKGADIKQTVNWSIDPFSPMEADALYCVFAGGKLNTPDAKNWNDGAFATSDVSIDTGINQDGLRETKGIGELLIEKGADVTRRYDSNTLLHVIANNYLGSPFRQRSFIQHNACHHPELIDVTNKYGNTALGQGLLIHPNYYPNIACELLKVGADPNVTVYTEANRRNPVDVLYLVAKRGMVDVVESLIEMGVSVKKAKKHCHTFKNTDMVNRVYPEELIDKSEKKVHENTAKNEHRNIGKDLRNINKEIDNLNREHPDNQALVKFSVFHKARSKGEILATLNKLGNKLSTLTGSFYSPKNLSGTDHAPFTKTEKKILSGYKLDDAFARVTPVSKKS